MHGAFSPLAFPGLLVKACLNKRKYFEDKNGVLVETHIFGLTCSHLTFDSLQMVPGSTLTAAS